MYKDMERLIFGTIFGTVGFFRKKIQKKFGRPYRTPTAPFRAYNYYARCLPYTYGSLPPAAPL